MPKKIIQDIYVTKKSIRMIKKSDVSDGFFVSKKIKPDIKEQANSISNTEDQKNVDDDGIVEERKYVTKDSLFFLWVICAISVATLLFFLSSAFATTTLNITPKNQTIVLDDTYTITSDTKAASSTLHYDVMTIKKDLSKTIENDGEEYAEKKALGKAIIYNNFSTANQRLITNTRLETKEGLVYRIRESVVVPGIKTVNGVKTPGSVEVDIIADLPGDKYNMALSDFKGDFTIPGFKGSTKYDKFYARLSADATGGYVGNVKKVSDDKLTAGKEELKTSLTNDLIKEVYAKKPEQKVLFNNNYYTECADLADDSTGDAYKITEECSINAIVFDKDMLSAFVAKNKIKNFDGSKIDAVWGDDFTVSVSGNSNQPWTETSLKAKFSGSVKIVWSFDTQKILDSIIGQDKNIISSVIGENKDFVSEIQATIKPAWKKTFPEKESRIKIIDTIRDINK